VGNADTEGACSLLIWLEGQKGEEADVILQLLVSRILLCLARLCLPRFQRLILLFEIPGPRSACRRISAQTVIFYAFGAGPSGQKSDNVRRPEMSKLQAHLQGASW
jgi:hypothetical protein